MTTIHTRQLQQYTEDNWQQDILKYMLKRKIAQPNICKITVFHSLQGGLCRFQWPRGLRCRSTAARLLRLWVRIPPGAWISVCCECCVLSGTGLCDALITRPEKSYQMWCVVDCDLETSRMRRSWPALGRSATKKKKGFSECGVVDCDTVLISGWLDAFRRNIEPPLLGLKYV